MKQTLCFYFGIMALASTAFAAPLFYPVATTNPLVPGGFANFTRFWSAGINNSTVAFIADGFGPGTVFVRSAGLMTNPVIEAVTGFLLSGADYDDRCECSKRPIPMASSGQSVNFSVCNP